MENLFQMTEVGQKIWEMKMISFRYKSNLFQCMSSGTGSISH